MNGEKMFVDYHPVTRIGVICWMIALIVSVLILRGYSGGVEDLRSSKLHFLALLGVVGLFLAAAGYFAYLFMNSIGTNSYPGPTSKLPARSRLYYGAIAVVSRAITFVAVVLLVAGPIAVLRIIL